MRKVYRELYISPSDNIITALKKMDAVKHKLLIVMEDGRYRSMLSIGDIQRAIIRGIDMGQPIQCILREKVNVASIHDDKDSVMQYVLKHKTEFMPIIDDDGLLVDIIFWDDLFNTHVSRHSESFCLPVIIMAGGKGTRLRPLTNVFPKPLIPIGDQTVMEDIMDHFVDCGCHDFYVSVNYKADIVKGYFDSIDKPQYCISYFQEDKPLGTAGSLHLLKDKINSTFFVSNCDIIIDEDYGAILKYHKENRNEITVVSAIKNWSIPYGTLETKEFGLLSGIKEKNEFTFKINTGMYVLEPHLINEIPVNTFYHITTLIEKLVKEGRRVGIYPISEGSWTDIGNWNEYLKILKR